jgi:hypothetical protein
MLCLVALVLSGSVVMAQAREFPINVTVHGGVALAPDAHPAIGVAVGVRPRPTPVSLEFEFARSRSEPAAGVPGIVTLQGNLLFQVPVRSARVEVYGTVGAGLYTLLRDNGLSEPNDARNFGGGVKVWLADPVKLRVDYRAIRLFPISGEYHSNAHRVSVGLVAGF